MAEALLLGLFALTLSGASECSAGEVYANSSNDIYVYDTVTGKVTGLCRSDHNFMDIAENVDGSLLGVDGDIYQIDLSNCSTRFKFRNGGGVGLVVDEHGFIYAGGRGIAKINPKSGAQSSFGPHGYTDGDMAISNGEMFWAHDNGISVLDVKTGALLRDLNGVGGYLGLAIDPENGDLLGFRSNGYVDSIDPSIGGIKKSTSTGIPWYGAAAKPVYVDKELPVIGWLGLGDAFGGWQPR